MIVPLSKNDKVNFRNPHICALDPKMVPLDHVLTNLFLLISSKGMPMKLGPFKKKHDMQTLMDRMVMLEEKGLIKGVSENKEAAENWLRANLVSMVFRGNVVKEKVSSLQPMHLMSYRIQNKSHNRDYFASDQIYMMLKSAPEVLSGLDRFLSRGWDKDISKINNSEQIDVDTAGILMLINDIKERPQANKKVDKVVPLLKKQTAIFNDDLRRLLVYQDVLPRNVFIEYFRILIGFHLALYEMNVIWKLPKMRISGTTEIDEDWNMVVDMTDNLDSRVSSYACKDIETLANSLNRYFKTTFEINAVQSDLKELRPENSDIEACLKYLKDELDPLGAEYRLKYLNLRKAVNKDDETKEAIDKMLQYFDEDDYFGRYIHLLENASGGSRYQYKYHLQCLDSLTMKNSESMLMASGVRSTRHPRRGAIGSKLLETLVQLLVLEEVEGGRYVSNPLSIEELASKIRERYGLIINGTDEPRFVDADVDTHAAFRENMEAFKNKLRQIGFYSDLSDSCILQKIQPRYKINE